MFHDKNILKEFMSWKPGVQRIQGGILWSDENIKQSQEYTKNNNIISEQLTQRGLRK